MLLKKVTIENFRSIEHLEIDILDIAGCKLHTFFGINETGKSNILKAIALLNPKATVRYEPDCNKKASKLGEPIKLKFIFEITQEDNFKKIMSSIATDVQVIDTFEPFKIEKVITFNENSAREEYYRINPSEWINNLTTDNHNSKSAVQNILNIFVAAADIFNKQKMEKCINADAKALIDGIVPEVLFWEPSDKYLIVNPVNMEQFKQNPDVSIPLKHIFYLAGYDLENIVNNIKRIQANADIRAEFEYELSEGITCHINRIWPEHPINIKVRLENNDLCHISVEDKGVERQRFNMDQRSDGFKQFISILLSLSVENATNQLKNKIILLDEPERSLHPGSIKCLRDELLRISENNILFVSSHSIYMVDKKNLDRHYTVKKENGKTFVEQVNPENPIQDEVIYNALGTSIFELIEPNMLIFEGRSDKDFFDAFTNKFRDEIHPSNILTISATGTKPIPHYVKFFHNKFVNGFVVVDSDKDGRDAIKAILQQDAEFKDSVFELKNLVNLEKQEATLEDLLPEELVISCANELYKINFESANGSSILSHIKSVKLTNSIHTDGKLEELKKIIINKALNDIKNKDNDTLKTEYPLYFDFATKLHSKIKEVNV
jgi:AAA15 family ATPase/GTPase